MVELWDLYDEDRVLLNKKHIRGIPVPKGEYHIVVDVWTINKGSKILITQRHPDKPFGLLWECTGGSITVGENNKMGALRELMEEIGISVNADELIPIHSIRLNDRFVDTYITIQDICLEDLKLQPEEVVDAKFVSYAELNEMLENGLIVPKERFRIYQKEFESYI